jgi:hypothetical protein
MRIAGRPPLSATSRAPNTVRNSMASFARVRSHTPQGSASWIVAYRRRLESALMGSGLVALLGLTTWAVASVSIWLVPVYLVLMVLVLASPRRERTSSPWEPSAGSPAPTVVELAQNRTRDGVAGIRDAPPESEANSHELSGAVSVVPGSHRDPAGSAIATPRRSRIQARKARKFAAEPSASLPGATWIRVGPGTFARVDLGTQVVKPPTAEAITDEIPAADAHATAAPPAPPSVATEAEAGAHDLRDATSGDENVSLTSGPTVPGTDTAVHGIAPSALGDLERAPSSVEILDHEVSGSLRFLLGQRRVHPTRGEAHASRSLRRLLAARRSPCVRRNAGLRPSARRWFHPERMSRRPLGRVHCVKHPWRARSPPDCLAPFWNGYASRSAARVSRPRGSAPTKVSLS